MRRLSTEQLVDLLALWLTLTPQWARQRFVAKRQAERDEGSQEIARLLAERLSDHEVAAPEPLAAHAAPEARPLGNGC